MFCFSTQADVPRHACEDFGPGPPSAVLHCHGYNPRGQQAIQVTNRPNTQQGPTWSHNEAFSRTWQLRLQYLSSCKTNDGDKSDIFQLCRTGPAPPSLSFSLSLSVSSCSCLATNGAWQQGFFVTAVLPSRLERGPFGRLTSRTRRVKPTKVLLKRSRRGQGSAC